MLTIAHSCDSGELRYTPSKLQAQRGSVSLRVLGVFIVTLLDQGLELLFQGL